MDWEKWQENKGQSGQPPDLEKMVENIKRLRGKMPSSYILIIIVILAWILSGIYIVAPDEVGVVKRFGKFVRTTVPGPHYHLPFPVESALTPKVTQIRRFEIGFRTVNPGPPPQYRPVSDEALMLTGDENIVDIQFIVQYKIKNATDFLFNVANPALTIPARPRRPCARSSARTISTKS